MLSIFFFFYLGASITVGGWVVEYLVAVRKDKLSHVGYISSAFYGGKQSKGLKSRIKVFEDAHAVHRSRGRAFLARRTNIPPWRKENVPRLCYCELGTPNYFLARA